LGPPRAPEARTAAFGVRGYTTASKSVARTGEARNAVPPNPADDRQPDQERRQRHDYDEHPIVPAQWDHRSAILSPVAILADGRRPSGLPIQLRRRLAHAPQPVSRYSDIGHAANASTGFLTRSVTTIRSRSFGTGYGCVVATNLADPEIQWHLTTMFVRFRQTRYRLQVSIVETHRVEGKVRHEHIASLGSIEMPPSVANRVAFWQRVHDRFGKLSNRIDPATQGKLRGDIHARIPMVRPEEQRALQLANAQADSATWGTLADMHAGTVEGQAVLIAGAERAKAVAAAEHAKASEREAGAMDRVARIERGEDVAGGLGKPWTVADLIAGGFTKAQIARFVQVHEVSKALGFDALMKAIHEATDRAERSTVRALHRRIRDTS
jgi:hypothetical protein